MSVPSEQDRLEELLSDEAVFGLSPEDRAELDGLVAGAADDPTADFEQASAAYYLAAAPLETEAMPVAVRQSLQRLAVTEAAATMAPATLKLTTPESAPRRSASSSPFWLAAVAASLMIGFWLGSPSPAPTTTAAEQRLALLESGAALTRVSWSATDDPAADGVEGEVVWSDAEQRGFMTFRGLAANDPGTEQYQLWIFDAERTAERPVDGGVFDIPTGADEVVTPIDAKLPVGKAVMFAITVERPGGVVVSDRSRLPLLAKVE